MPDLPTKRADLRVINHAKGQQLCGLKDDQCSRVHCADTVTMPSQGRADSASIAHSSPTTHCTAALTRNHASGGRNGGDDLSRDHLHLVARGLTDLVVPGPQVGRRGHEFDVEVGVVVLEAAKLRNET